MSFPYALVVFDLDGTLVDSASDIAEAVNRTLVDWSLPRVEEPVIRGWIGDGARLLLHRALAHAGGDLPAGPAFDAAYAVLMRHYGASLPLQAVAYPGADEALRGLRARGVRIALCTNKPERFIAPLLEALQWQTLFDAIVGGDTLAERKPSPAPLLYIAERFGVPAGQALMVGDSQTDADAAQAAGMPLLLVRYGYHHGRVPEAGDAVAFTDDLRSLL